MQYRNVDPLALARILYRASLARLFSFVVICTLVSLTSTAFSSDLQIEQFEKEIRPLFIEHCLECHNEDANSGKLTLTSRATLLTGGETGPAVTPGDASKSLLIYAVRRTGELKMPPETPLSESEIRSLTQWIDAGAVWPETSAPLVAQSQSKAKKHWAFQPLGNPKVPDVGENDWVRNPIDAFVLQKLQEHDLAPAPQADDRTLLRRLSYTLTGLPPKKLSVQTVRTEHSEGAYEKEIEHSLNSPHYGEHWGRHWLDVARYADTKGYVYAREERFWPHAWAYRDWVIRALNEDLPYNRFLLLQLAADQVPDRNPGDMAAMGFLTLGRRFLGVDHLIIDDRIDVVCRGTMGLTVGCARCHDHKYDPIPTADYYSLYGVFSSSTEQLSELPHTLGETAAFEAELEKRMEALATKLTASREETSTRARSRLRDYLFAQKELGKYPPKGFDQIFSKSDILPEFVWRWHRYLENAEQTKDSVFLPWFYYLQLSPGHFARDAIEVTKLLNELPPETVHPEVLSQFRTVPESFHEVISRYASLFETIRIAVESPEFSGSFENPDQESLRRILYGADSPFSVPDESIVQTEFFFDSGTLTQLWKLQGEVDRWIIQSKEEVPFALTLRDRKQVSDAHVHIRGNPIQTGRRVPRQFLQILEGDTRTPFVNGSGRFELAQNIIDPQNPLTARVMVNRVWTHHFGQGLVTTPSDFGLRATPPSHPELLDWLTHRFIESGWSLKQLHRLILTSATFRQQSQVANSENAHRARLLDPENRMLWKMNAHRLTFEEYRDTLLAVSGDLDPALGGKPQDLFKAPYPHRRTVYGLVDRQYLPGTLRVFDFANPDLHVPVRSETTVPQQALFSLNHPLVLDQVRSLAAEGEELKTTPEQVEFLFDRTLQRFPSQTELEEGLAFLAHVETAPQDLISVTHKDWSYGYGKLDEKNLQVLNFQLLPHFSGTAWQGGEKWPDSKLGWVQLTATGGHPGNDREHAAIRRWTAPAAGEYKIETKLVHEAAPGDGIRAFIVGSKGGLLARTELHQKTQELNVPTILLSAGDTIDFIVDIGQVLNSDQYLWDCNVSPVASELPLLWNSQIDFTHDDSEQMSPLEQLAHLIVCTNEFYFVD